MKRLQWGVMIVGILAIVGSLVGGALLTGVEARQAARSGTSAAIAAAQAKENSQNTQKAIANLGRTENGVEQLLQFVANYQSGTQAKRSAENARWYVAEMQAICAAVHCKQVPLPPGLP